MNRSFTAVATMLIIMLAFNSHSLGFWDRDQVIVDGSSLSVTGIRHIRADVTSRVVDNNAPLEKYTRPGVDGWLSYTATEDDVSKILVKYYQFNNIYPRSEGWFYDLVLPDIHCAGTPVNKWGQDIAGDYFRTGMDVSRGTPAAYCSWFEQSPTETGICVARIRITDSDQYEIKYSNSWEVTGLVDETCETRIKIVNDDVFVIWEDIDPQSGNRSININSIDVNIIPEEPLEYMYDPKPVFNLVQGVPSDIAYDMNMYVEEVKDVYVGTVAWKFSYYPGVEVVRAKAFRYIRTSGIGLSCPGDYLELASTTVTPSYSNPKVLMPEYVEKTDDNSIMLVSWLNQGNPVQGEIQTRNIHINLSNPGWLEADASTDIIPFSGMIPQYSMAADRGFLRPENLDYDSSSGRIAFVQMGNHRVSWFTDPYSDSYGAWITELYEKAPKNNGAINRTLDTAMPVLRIRQTAEIVVPLVNGPGYSLHFDTRRYPESMTESTLCLRSQTMPLTIIDLELEEIEMTCDDFSSYYCFFLVSDTQGDQSIRWVCDGLLLNATEPGVFERDRLTYPYDIDFIPPVWTPTPTPTPPPSATGTPPTQPPTWTPRPDGIWVADMAGHRAVRMNEYGVIEAQTYADIITEYTPVWSEYEECTVVSPNDISAAYDGSCWVIDWGRNEVVKVNVDGSEAARTEACEIPDPEQCLSQLLMIHPVAIDCAGSPDTCFVADYEGNQVYKLAISGETINATPSQATYRRPKAVSISRELQEGSETEWVDNVWVADRWNYTPTPSQSWTFTPVPTRTPTPGTGTPTQEPWTPTPFPEIQRVTQNRFGWYQFENDIYCSIPFSLSIAFNASETTHCWIADRDAGNSGTLTNFVRCLIINGQSVQEIDIPAPGTPGITRPVDVDVVGQPPTFTPTPAP